MPEYSHEEFCRFVDLVLDDVQGTHRAAMHEAVDLPSAAPAVTQRTRVAITQGRNSA